MTDEERETCSYCDENKAVHVIEETGKTACEHCFLLIELNELAKTLQGDLMVNRTELVNIAIALLKRSLGEESPDFSGFDSDLVDRVNRLLAKTFGFDKLDKKSLSLAFTHSRRVNDDFSGIF